MPIIPQSRQPGPGRHPRRLAHHQALTRILNDVLIAENYTEEIFRRSAPDPSASNRIFRDVALELVASHFSHRNAFIRANFSGSPIFSQLINHERQSLISWRYLINSWFVDDEIVRRLEGHHQDIDMQPDFEWPMAATEESDSIATTNEGLRPARSGWDSSSRLHRNSILDYPPYNTGYSTDNWDMLPPPMRRVPSFREIAAVLFGRAP